MTSKQRTPASVAAHIVSDVFSPMLAPTYALLAALCLTPMSLLPTSPKVWATAGIVFITAIIPMLFILLLIRMGKVSDTAITDRNERTAPFCATILCYIGAAFFVRYLRAPYWIQNFYLAAAMVAAISLLVTHWWKISAHTGAAAGLAALVFWLASRGALRIDDFAAVSATVVVLAAVAWARLWLRRHTPAQVLAGAAAAFLIVYLILHNFSI